MDSKKERRAAGHMMPPTWQRMPPARSKVNSKETLKNSWPPKKQVEMLSKEVAETVWQANQSGCKKGGLLGQRLAVRAAGAEELPVSKSL